MRVLSFGAGVQSTALLVAAQDGLIEPFDLVIFADTQAEPQSVYDWLAFVQYSTKQDIVIVSRGNIVADGLSEKRWVTPPFFVRNQNGQKGMIRRQCTSDYKIKPIHDYLRPYKGTPISLIMGISTDECGRAKKSRVKWIEHEFPLLWPDLPNYGGVLGWNRAKCIEYVKETLKRAPPKSACYFCPYHTDAEWARMKSEEPEAFEAACALDEAIRHRGKIECEIYVHPSLKPLAEVDFKTKYSDPNQLTFLDECDGMCGV